MGKKKKDSYLRKEGRKLLTFLLYVVFGLYFINYTFEFVEIPEFVLGIEKWIILVGGILIIIGGIRSLFSGKKIKLNKLDKVLKDL